MNSSNAKLTVSEERKAAVVRASEDWISKLIDLSRNNRLLFFRELKIGTLDLSDADPIEMARFLNGNAISVTLLLPRSDERITFARAQEIRRTALSNLEEKGLETLFVAFGFATWPPADDGRPPQSPIVMLPVSLQPQGKGSRAINIKITGEPQINPILLYILEKEHGLRLQPESLLSPAEAADDSQPVDPQAICKKLVNSLARLKGFQLTSRSVLGNFAFQKMAMVKDLQDDADLLVCHDIVSAMAGDNSAKEKLRSTQQSIDPRDLDLVPPENEFLVLDADSSQQASISAVLKGQSGVVIGPPGTGKSQTIANLIAELSARGHRVLFVAEKRVALEVVMERLRTVGLGYLALDLHGAAITRKEVMKQFAESLSLIRDSLPVEQTAHEKFVDRRERLNRHANRLHARRPPSGLSFFEMQGRLLRSGPDQRCRVRWRGGQLHAISRRVADEIRDLLTEFGAFSGLLWRTDTSPWIGSRLPDGHAAQQAVDSVSRLHASTWANLLNSIHTMCAEAEIKEPKTLDELDSLLGFIDKIRSTLELFKADVFRQDLNSLRIALAPCKHWPSRLSAWCFRKDYRSARKLTAALSLSKKVPLPVLYDHLEIAAAQLRRWTSMAASMPTAPAFANRCRENLNAVLVEVARLASVLGRDDLYRLQFDALERLIGDLASDTNTPYRLPRFAAIEHRLLQLGAGAMIAELRDARPDPQIWSQLFDYAWVASCFEQVRADDPELAAFTGQIHKQFVEEFCNFDRQRLQLAASRTRRAHAEWAINVMNTHPEQADIVKREANKKARHLPLRKLLGLAPDVLTALRPCWLASPLSVSELIPTERSYFDVVLFDEASQVPPEDAVPALLRGSMAVVAGDQNQLPPTKFFTTDGDGDEEAQPEAVTAGFESLLDQLLTFLNPWFLDWHYRSRDEALIAFSNRHIYGDRLVTFPGLGGPPSISHILVDCIPEQDGQEESSSQEVRKVVELILRHAIERPNETLGVIAMGIKHARRIEAALDLARISRPDLDLFFDETRKERFFVKNLERVQGDERDTIILSVGYGKDRSGRLMYRFGPLLTAGGERRLNVAVTRARRRMILVSSFDHHDMDPSRSRARGVELLRLYIEFAASHGRRLGDAGPQPFPLNSFESDVYEALTARGIPLIPQYGASKYRIDFVGQHPQRRGRLVLAIECDGASYHSAPTARDRDRLRQEHLEALGFRFHRIWSTDWFTQREQEIRRAHDAFRTAVTHANQMDSRRGQKIVSPASHVPVSAPSAFGRGKARGPAPNVAKKETIDDYHIGELMAWVNWIESDGRLRTDEQVVDELTRLLFHRKGARIESRIRQAVGRVRTRQAASQRSSSAPTS